MICRDCQFDCPDTAVFCTSCGCDLTARARKSKPTPGIVKRASYWLGWIAVSGLGGVALLPLVLPRENTPTALETQPVEISQPKEASKPPALKQTPKRINAMPADRLEEATLRQWQMSKFSTRLAFAANYITPRATMRSTTELTNSAVRLEGCISKSAANDSTSLVGSVAAACFSQLLRPR